MKSTTLYAGAVLACALGLSACGGGSGDLPLTVSITGGVTKEGLVLVNKRNGDEVAVPANQTSVQFTKFLATDDEFEIDKKSMPSNVSDCTFINNKARANYYTIYTQPPAVFCTIKTHPLTVTVRGVTGTGLVLVNGADRVTVAAAATSATLPNVPEDGPYGITILSQPSGQTCSVTGGTGLMTASGPGTAPLVTCSSST